MPDDVEIVDDHLPAKRPDQVPATASGGAPATFNPLDADPTAFRQEVEKRQANYDALLEFLKSKMRPGHDYGPVHVVKGCPDKHRCTNPAHYSANTLKDAGADTVLTLLGLGVRYKGEDGYRQATLTGVQIRDVVLTAYVVAHTGQVLSEATGAASTSEHNQDLHNTIAKAQKRARVAAVRALPTVRALFADDTTPDAADLASSRRMRAAEPRRHDGSGGPPKPGRQLETMPIGKHKGVPFSQIDGKYLTWCVENMEHADVVVSARAELDRRRLQEPEPPPAAPDNERVTLPDDDEGFDDGPPLDNYFR